MYNLLHLCILLCVYICVHTVYNVYIRCIMCIDNCKYVYSTLCVLSICMCILHIVHLYKSVSM